MDRREGRRPDLPLRPPAGDRPLRPHRHRGGPRRRPHQGRRLRHRQPQIRPLAHGGVDHRRRGPRPENPHGALRGRGRTVRPLRERRDAQCGRHLPHGREQQHGGRSAGRFRPEGVAARIAEMGARADKGLGMARTARADRKTAAARGPLVHPALQLLPRVLHLL